MRCGRIPTVKSLISSVLCLGATWGAAQVEPSEQDSNVAGCVRNLKLIHEALFVYAAEVGEFPDTLSALVDAELLDRQYLLCPEGREGRSNGVRFGELINSVPDESKTWYKWEYQVDGLEYGWTSRVRKEKQRKVGAGGWVPLVRCDQHSQLGGELSHINLGYGGGIYFTGLFWEFAINEVIPASYLISDELFNAELDSVRSIWERMPDRLEEASPKLVDLGARFNCLLDTQWIRNGAGERAAELLGSEPTTGRLLNHGGVNFEIRGGIQLEGQMAGPTYRFSDSPEARYPDSMPPLRISDTARKLHALCGVIGRVPSSTKVAELGVVDAEGNPIRLDLRYGYEVSHGQERLRAENATYAWGRESNDEGEEFLAPLSVSHVVWDLGRETRIESFSFEATEAPCFPFVLALTLE